MASVRLLVAMSGPDQAWSVGARYDCDEATAHRLIAVGYAEPIPEAPEVPETMEAAGPRDSERAVKPRGRRKLWPPG